MCCNILQRTAELLYQEQRSGELHGLDVGMILSVIEQRRYDKNPQIQKPAKLALDSWRQLLNIRDPKADFDIRPSGNEGIGGRVAEIEQAATGEE